MLKKTILFVMLLSALVSCSTNQTVSSKRNVASTGGETLKEFTESFEGKRFEIIKDMSTEPGPSTHDCFGFYIEAESFDSMDPNKTYYKKELKFEKFKNTDLIIIESSYAQDKYKNLKLFEWDPYPHKIFNPRTQQSNRIVLTLNFKSELDKNPISGTLFCKYDFGNPKTKEEKMTEYLRSYMDLFFKIND